MKYFLLVIIVATAMSFSISRDNSHATSPTITENNDSIKTRMLRDWERAKLFTKEYIDAMPEEGLSFKPTPEIRSFAEQMLHLAQGTVYLISNGTGKARIYADKNLEKSDEYKTKEALKKVVMESYDYAIDAIKNFDFNKSGETTKRGNFDVARIDWIDKAFEHQTHHRGQCTIYLRLKGVTPPNERLF